MAQGPVPYRPRPARLVINQLVRENEKREWVCYGIICVCLVAGLAVVAGGLYLQSTPLTLTGLGGGGALLWVPLRSALYLWRTNAAIRLLEVPLERTSTAHDAAEMLYKSFPDVFKGGR